MRPTFALMLALLAGAAWADGLDDAALALPGSAPQEAGNARVWQLFVEGAAARSQMRHTSPAVDDRSTQRLSVDLQFDKTLAPGVRAMLADRLDIGWQHRFEQRQSFNTLKEAYLSWQPRDDVIVDLGYVNQYSGVAIGYNPTDFFREGSVRSPVSVDPTVIKKNRQGSAMLRGQILWEDASLTALYSPALNDPPDSPAFPSDRGATNQRDRSLLIFSKRISEDLQPQWLLYTSQGASPRFGMNLTKLVNDATVAYVEWSGGRSPLLLAQALGQDGNEAFRNRVASGLTYTTSNKLSLTLEYQYNGAGLDNARWNALPMVSLPAYLRYRQFVQSAQEMPTRHQTFIYTGWQDMLVRHLDLAAMVRRNSDDHSRLSWVELRYRWTRDEIALQWQGNSGQLFSDYGASPLRKAWEISFRHFY
jgi:hypothetical protein